MQKNYIHFYDGTNFYNVVVLKNDDGELPIVAKRLFDFIRFIHTIIQNKTKYL